MIEMIEISMSNPSLDMYTPYGIERPCEGEWLGFPVGQRQWRVATSQDSISTCKMPRVMQTTARRQHLHCEEVFCVSEPKLLRKVVVIGHFNVVGEVGSNTSIGLLETWRALEHLLVFAGALRHNIPRAVAILRPSQEVRGQVCYESIAS